MPETVDNGVVLCSVPYRTLEDCSVRSCLKSEQLYSTIYGWEYASYVFTVYAAIWVIFPGLISPPTVRVRVND